MSKEIKFKYLFKLILLTSDSNLGATLKNLW